MNVDDDVEQDAIINDNNADINHVPSSPSPQEADVIDDSTLPTRHVCRCDSSSSSYTVTQAQHCAARSTTTTACQVTATRVNSSQTLVA